VPLKVSEIAKALRGVGDFEQDRLWIVPSFTDALHPDNDGNASIDLRLGRWFLTLRATSEPLVEVRPDGNTEERFSRKHFVRFDDRFVLHPGRFVLGATLEWVRMPHHCVGSIVGKSSLGRRGLIIETAPLVHPNFSGCLTLELANVGEIPIALRPGMQIAQLIIEHAEGSGRSQSNLRGFRRPVLGTLKSDEVASKLQQRAQPPQPIA